MGSSFAGRVIREVLIAQCKKARGLRVRSPPACKETACTMGFEKVYNNYYAREAILVDGAMFLKPSLHSVNRKRGGWAGCSLPHLQTQRLQDDLEVVLHS